MRILSWNVNGIRSVHNKELFVPCIEKLQPDILCLQETKAQQHQSEVVVPKYEEFWCSAEKKGYAGTAIFTKILPVQVIFGIPDSIATKYTLVDQYGDTTREGRVLTLEFEHYFVSTVYTPNAKDDLSRIPMRLSWDPAYLEFMCSLEKKKPVIFCGDFNVAHTELDLARPKENVGNKGYTQEERNGFSAYLNHGFVDTFRLFTQGNGYYTWWSHWGKARERNVGWRIDYVMASQALTSKIQGANIHPEIMGSDHCPVSIDITL